MLLLSFADGTKSATMQKCWGKSCFVFGHESNREFGNQFFISGLSGDAIIKNRVLEAHYCRIIKAEKENKCFRIIIVIPLLPGFQGEIDDGGAASVRAIMHCQYRTTCRGPNSILQKLYDLMGPRATEFISFYGLRAYGRLCDGGPLVTNQINVLIEDKEFVESLMDGKPWKAGKFSHCLRLLLWLEHLGLRAEQFMICFLTDQSDSGSSADATYRDIWMVTAETNTMMSFHVSSTILSTPDLLSRKAPTT
ncbi:phospholipase d [Musa troglodytarum]|uniref:Phospholipase d n=1 Tax=Musa troglodytarum TaxID=320322 RepID=A0A9E7JHL6_9LILI|nr:phospholipase d [Musa troglodytarum]